MGKSHKPSPDKYISLKCHLLALRDADLRFDVERDRRYAEVSIEREKALKIKEVADLAALDLARQIQTYKDEKANELREQINRERVLYATKEDMASAVRELKTEIKPLADYVTSQQGRTKGYENVWGFIIGGVGMAAAVVAIFARFSK